MSESSQHIRLVLSIIKYVKEFLFPENDLLISCDIDFNSYEIPPLINGFRPDVLIKNINSNFIIIGEAKTNWDLEKEHTYRQFIAFLDYCDLIKTSILIIAVRWDLAKLAKSIIINLKKQNKYNNCDTIIIEKLPG